MAPPKELCALLDRFEMHRDAYRSGKYNETQLRREFLDPFFELLGWDVLNRKGWDERYKEVVHEDAVKIGGWTKAPDYAFRIGGVRKFFVEAKNPSKDLKDDPEPAYQLRRYAWSAKLPLSILTDFEEFAVYDCRVKPSKTDKASVGRTLYLTYTEYADRWEEIAGIFSQDAVHKGSFDKYAESKRKKRGTAEVDDAFLQQIEVWREELARNLALRNADLTVRELNSAVQRTIDRIIFLRICEDRGIEDYGQLQALQNAGRVYARLAELFQRADERYNSGLFHFRKEKGRAEPPDELTLGLSLDDKVLKDIIAGLYYPDSPYEFAVLPADILGQVYEQFLGKVIRLTAGHHAKVEEKPEVRKAGGVYYTPTYIVDYIVEQTVGKQLEGKTPRQAESLRIVDPACGSGSFLIGAYQRLLDWHRDWYFGHGSQKHAKEGKLYEGPGGEWRLTTAERKRILTNNIYGVDIDPQAVEVTKLSLLLKVLEGESAETIQTSLRLFRERALPDLASNIKCGNSLIGSDFYKDRPMDLFDEEERYRINVFDWEDEFPEVFGRKNAGFDVVIGNPPYGATLSPDERAYCEQEFETAGRIADIFTLFIERGIRRLSSGGRLSFIVPSAWLGGPQYVDLRSLLLRYSIDRLILLPFDVFADAYVDTAVFVLCGRSCPTTHTIRTHAFARRAKLNSIEIAEDEYQRVPQADWAGGEDRKFILNPAGASLLHRLRSSCPRALRDVAELRRGVLFDMSLLCSKKETPQHRRYFEGNVYRYHVDVAAPRWIEFGDCMKERPKELRWFESNRILLRRLVNRRQRLMAGATSEPFISNKNLYSVLPCAPDVDVPLLLAVLNSRLVSFLYVLQVSQAIKDDFPQVTIKDVQALPFPGTLPPDTGMRIASLVADVTRLQRDLRVSRTEHLTTTLTRQIAATDRQIDQLVYELYGLTDKEIRIVEEATKG